MQPIAELMRTEHYRLLVTGELLRLSDGKLAVGFNVNHGRENLGRPKAGYWLDAATFRSREPEVMAALAAYKAYEYRQSTPSLYYEGERIVHADYGDDAANPGPILWIRDRAVLFVKDANRGGYWTSYVVGWREDGVERIVKSGTFHPFTPGKSKTLGSAVLVADRDLDRVDQVSELMAP